MGYEQVAEQIDYCSKIALEIDSHLKYIALYLDGNSKKSAEENYLCFMGAINMAKIIFKCESLIYQRLMPPLLKGIKEKFLNEVGGNQDYLLVKKVGDELDDLIKKLETPKTTVVPVERFPDQADQELFDGQGIS